MSSLQPKLAEFSCNTHKGVLVHPSVQQHFTDTGRENKNLIFMVPLNFAGGISTTSHEMDQEKRNRLGVFYPFQLLYNPSGNSPLICVPLVFELGVCCGDITRQEAKLGLRVPAAKLSSLHSNIKWGRCWGLSNLRFCCSNFGEVSYSDNCGFVLSNRSVEYREQLINRLNPIQHVLETVNEISKYEGALIIARNQRCLERLWDYREPRSAARYEGLAVRDRGDTPVMVGKRELISRTQRSDGLTTRFHDTYRDCKLSEGIFTDGICQNAESAAADSVRYQEPRDYSATNFKPIIRGALAAPIRDCKSVWEDFDKYSRLFTSPQFSHLPQAESTELAVQTNNKRIVGSMSLKLNIMVKVPNGFPPSTVGLVERSIRGYSHSQRG